MIALFAALAALLALPGWALAVDKIYWGNYEGDRLIRVANLDGSGAAQTLYEEAGSPGAVALDPASGRMYWANNGAGSIRVGNLDGSGTPQDLFSGEEGALGLAIDPAANKIYWATFTFLTGAIRVANLDGTGTPQDLYTGESQPAGVAIDPAANRIYWTNFDGGAVRFGSLDGTLPAATLFPGGSRGSGVAIDPAANRIYWIDFVEGDIRTGNLDGSGVPSNLFSEEWRSGGLAIDPGTHAMYWSQESLLRTGSLTGAGAAATLFGPEGGPPSFPAILRAPAGVGAPAIAGSGAPGGELSCGNGAWAPNLLGAQLYRAPATIALQWLRDGAEIPGATQATLSPPLPGVYTCRASASNHAGQSAQLSEQLRVGSELPAKLSIRRARLAGGRLAVRGSLDRAAAGEAVTVRLGARGRSIQFKAQVRPNGNIRFARRLAGRQRDARAGRLTIDYAGNDVLRAARVQLRAARRPAGLRLSGAQLRGQRLIATGGVARRAGGRVVVRVEFNQPNGVPSALVHRVKVSKRGHWRLQRKVPPEARSGAHVTATIRGAGLNFGQQLSRPAALR